MSRIASHKVHDVRVNPQTPGPRTAKSACAASLVAHSDARETSAVEEVSENVQIGLESPSVGLPEDTRRALESRIGYDFSKVRIHHDASANRSSDSLNATAYTLGEDIVFGPGQFAPSRRTGLALLAHELTHVVQNNGRDFKSGNSLRNLSRHDAAETEASNVEANFFNVGRVTGKVDAARGNATFIDSTQAGVIFSFAGGKAKEAFPSSAGPLPADIAKGSYGGHIFVDQGGGNFLHLAP